MSLDNLEVVDFVGTLRDGSGVVLTLVDYWDWADEMPHLLALQTKLNAYFAFIETGELHEAYPDAVGRDVIIDVVARLPIPEIGLALLDAASEVAAGLPARITHRVTGNLRQDFID